MRQDGTNKTKPDVAPYVASVWTAEPCLSGAVLHLLNREERARLDRFRFERDADSYASAHALTRLALSARDGTVDPAAWRFRDAEFGKPEISPEIPPKADLRFNLSHTSGLVATATLIGAEVGVDVEAVGTRAVAEELRERVLSPLESQELDSIPGACQAMRFFGIWSVKESYIKARGLGLRLPLKEISFAFPREATPDLVATPAGSPDAPGDWTVHLDYLSQPMHALAVTAGHTAHGPAEIHVTHVDLAALAQGTRQA